MNTAQLLLGDCFDRMAELPDCSIDLVLCDPPYGTTEAAWDRVLPFDRLWPEYRRLARPGAAIVLMAQQPFTTHLISSNPKAFRYCWVWRKNRITGFANAKKRPLKATEDVVVFCDRPAPYHPQGVRLLDRPRRSVSKGCETMPGRGFRDDYRQTVTGYPLNVLEFKTERGLHPTQKPVALMEYLVRTYTQPGATVLDNTMGSGTTGVACLRSGRSFVGIERDPEYFARAEARIAATQPLPLAEAA